MSYKQTKKLIRIVLVAISIFIVILGLLLGMPEQAKALVDDVTPTPPFNNTNLIPKLQEIVADTSCKLPCFLGFTPRKTTAHQVADFIHDQLNLEHQNSIVTVRDAINYQLGLFFNPGGGLFVNIKAMKNLLNRMDVVLINSEEWLKDYNPFDLPVLLDVLGKPSEIYLALQGMNPLTNVITIVYEDQGVMVQYMNAFTDDSSNDPLQICPKLEGAVHVEAWLQSPDASKPVTDYLEPSPDAAADTRGANWTLERLAGIDIDDFIKLILASSNPCFQIPSTTDLYNLGYQIS